jgi:hypothetical protein
MSSTLCTVGKEELTAADHWTKEANVKGITLIRYIFGEVSAHSRT